MSLYTHTSSPVSASASASSALPLHRHRYRRHPVPLPLPLLVLLHFLLLLLSPLPLPAAAQSARRNGGNADQFDPVNPGTDVFRARSLGRCPRHYRTYDGSCTNVRHKLWGSAGTPHFSYTHHHSSSIPSGSHLPSARYVSNALCAQAYDQQLFNRRRLSEFLVFFGQFIDHTFAATAVNKSEPMPIPIPSHDPIFANFSTGRLPFHRSVRGTVVISSSSSSPSKTNSTMRGIIVERPINSLSSAIDLAVIYSSDNDRIGWLRTYRNGMLKMSPRHKLPLNTDGIVNAPTKEAKYFLSGDHRVNEHPVLTALHTIFVREHNRLAKELRIAFPTWTDHRLFHTARKINGAQFQKIVYDEWLPTLTGRRLRAYRGYRGNINPTLSSVFTTAAFRLGHTMVGHDIPRRGVNNTILDTVRVRDMFFRPHDVMGDGIEPFVRGVLNRRAQEVDLLVVPTLRNFLFSNVRGESGFDLVALNVQRGRDHALPSYNEVRVLFGRRRAKRFSDVTKDVAVQSRLQSVYGNVDRVEAWVGLMAEDHVKGGSVGRTLFKVLRREFGRLRDGDRFFYQRWNLFPWALCRNFPRLRQMLFERDTMRQILLRNTDVTEEEIGESVWTA